MSASSELSSAPHPAKRKDSKGDSISLQCKIASVNTAQSTFLAGKPCICKPENSETLPKSNDGGGKPARLLEHSTTQLMPPPLRPTQPLESHGSRTASSLLGGSVAESSGRYRAPASNNTNLLTPNNRLSITTNTSKPSKKVILAPGHSPLDWAALTRSGTDLAGVQHTLRVTSSQLAEMNGRKDRSTGLKKPAWTVWQGKVYNITPYLPFHPGGEGELMRGAGKGAEKLFMEVHPWVNWESMLGSCLVGFLVKNDGCDEDDLEAMD